MKLIKAYQYTPVTAAPFDIPFPVYFELYWDDLKLASYRVTDEFSIDYWYNSIDRIPVLTPQKGSLSINDIYFLLTIRVFPKGLPFTQQELKLLGLDEYNPYYIATKTHGIMQNDKYWLKFPDVDNINTYMEAAENFMKLHAKSDDGEQKETVPEAGLNGQV